MIDRSPIPAAGGRPRPETSEKQEARRLANNLPDDATWEDLQYQIDVRQAIEAQITRHSPRFDRLLEAQLDILAVVHAARRLPRGIA